MPRFSMSRVFHIILFLVAAAAAVYLSLNSTFLPPAGWDKEWHITACALLSIIGGLMFSKWIFRLPFLGLIAVAGLGMEFAQQYFPPRESSIEDAFANGIGIGIALVVLLIVSGFSAGLNRRIRTECKKLLSEQQNRNPLMSKNTNTPAPAPIPVDVATAKAWLEAGEAILIDVREVSEYRDAHIDGAILLPLSNFAPTNIPQNPDKKIIMQCKSGGRSNKAGSAVLEYCASSNSATPAPEVYNLVGGITAWAAAGFLVLAAK